MSQPAKAATHDLKIGFLEAVDSLNPFIGINDPSYVLYGLVYDYLFSFDQDGNYVPNIAVAASCDSVCMNWTYQIRQGVVWSDGTNLTADDVAFSVNYQLPSGNSFFHLWAFEPYLNQIVTCTGGKKTGCGAQITSPWNVTVYFDRPFVPGKALFILIIQKAQWSAVSAQSAQTTFTNSNMIGTGPFIASPDIYNEMNTGAPLHLSVNSKYHPVGNHTGPSPLDNIYLEQFQTETQLETSLENQAIDLAKMTSQGIPAVQGKPNIATQEGLLSTQYWNEIGIEQMDSSAANGRLNPARWDVAVRRAMAMATDKDYIVQTVYGGKGVRGDTLISPISPWWYDPTSDPGANLSFDVQAANALLNASGYTQWTGGSFGSGYRQAASSISLSIQTNACLCQNPTNTTKTVPAGQILEFSMGVRNEFPQELQTATDLTAMWQKIGIKLDVTSMLESELSNEVYGGYLDTYIWYWSSDQDPNYMLSMQSWVTLDGWSDNNWNNATYNNLYVQQLSDVDPTQRHADVRAAQKLEYESAPYIIYIYPYGEWAYRTDTCTGWGDFVNHPYRQVDAFWGANPLFFDLQCTGAAVTNYPPTTPSIQPGYVAAFTNYSQTFVGTSSDVESTDTLTWTFHWGDTTSNTTSQPATVTSYSASHTWTRPGNYSVTLTVSDAFNPPVTSAAAYANVSVATTPLGMLKGIVKDLSGTPIQGVHIATSPGGYGQATSASGTYSFALPADTYSVTASARYWQSHTQPGVIVAANASTWVNFTLAPSNGWIAGIVKSAADGSKLVGAAVFLTPASGVEISTHTDSVGYYNFSADPGTYTVGANATGYESKSISGVNVTTGQTTTLDFPLTPVASPSGLSPLLIGGIGVAVVVLVVAAVAFVMLRRRKRREEEESKLNIPKKE